jgi:carbon-monoxide dehydrogenase medium subunit
MGTAVGNLCVATPASDVATALLALGAQLKIAGRESERTEPIEKFYVDYRLTSLRDCEMVTQVVLPDPSPGTGAAFFNLVRTHADIAKIIVAATIAVRDGVCREARIAIGAAAPTAFRAARAEALVTGQKITPGVIDEAAEMAAEEIKPITDIRSTAEYRREMTRVLVKQALEKALKNAER